MKVTTHASGIVKVDEVEENEDGAIPRMGDTFTIRRTVTVVGIEGTGGDDGLIVRVKINPPKRR